MKNDDDDDNERVPTTGDGVRDLVRRLDEAEELVRGREAQIVGLRVALMEEKSRYERAMGASVLAVLAAVGFGWVIGAGYLLVIISWILAVVIMGAVGFAVIWYAWNRRPRWAKW